MPVPVVRATALVIVVGWVLGLAQAVIWAQLAPGVASKVLPNGSWGQLPTESAHAFTSVAIFVCLGLIIGVVGGLVVWQIRMLRGIPGLAALLIGAIGSGGFAFLLAPGLVSGIDAATVGATGKEIVVVAAPVLDLGTMTDLGKFLFVLALILVQAAAGAFVYSFSAFLSDRGDLGRPARRPASDAASAATTNPIPLPGRTGS